MYSLGYMTIISAAEYKERVVLDGNKRKELTLLMGRMKLNGRW